MLRVRALSLLLLLLLPCAESAAEVHCKAIAGGVESLVLIDADTRLRYIQRRLQHAAWRARIWSATWMTAYSASAVINFGLAIGNGPVESQPDRYVAGASSLIGVASLAAMPLKVMRDRRWLDDRIARAPADTDRCALLADAERLMLRDAANQAFGRGPLVHVGTFLINTGVALVLTLGFNRAEQGMTAAFIGIGVGEIQIATQPVNTIDDLRRYREGQLDVPPEKHAFGWSILPMLSRDQAGLALALAF